MMNSFVHLFLLGEVMISSFAAQPLPGCTAFLNGGQRNCCPTTGLCQDSSCVVFGFPNSAKSNCALPGGQCQTIYCDWTVPNCSKLSDSVHCYGTVKCTDGSTSCCADGAPCSGNDYGALCLGDGNGQNYKVCDNTCNNDNDCNAGLKCVGQGNDKHCVAASPSPSPLPSRSASPLPSPLPSRSPSGSPSRSKSPSQSPSQSLQASGSSSQSPSQSPLPSPSPSPSPDSTNAQEQPDQCTGCPDSDKPAECVAVEQENDALGIPKLVVPSCDFNQLLDALQPYGCKVVDDCNTVFCEELIPDGALDPAFHACQMNPSDESITTQ